MLGFCREIVYAVGLRNVGSSTIGLGIVTALALGIMAAPARSQGQELLISPTEARERDFYAPNSETLAPVLSLVMENIEADNEEIRG